MQSFSNKIRFVGNNHKGSIYKELLIKTICKDFFKLETYSRNVILPGI